MDLVDEFAFPLPITVIAELLGIPVADRDRFRLWSNAIMTPALSPAEIARAGELIGAFVAYLRDLFVHRRGTPGDDLISASYAWKRAATDSPSRSSPAWSRC